GRRIVLERLQRKWATIIMMIVLRVALAVLALTGIPAFAQTCASPIDVVTTGFFDRTTCGGTNQLPYLANGAIAASGAQEIYHVLASDSQGVALHLQPLDAGLDLSLLICRDRCSAYATCTAAADASAGSSADAPLPDGPGEYYIVVGATEPTC